MTEPVKRGPGRPRKPKAANPAPIPETFPPRPAAPAPSPADSFTVEGAAAPILESSNPSTGGAGILGAGPLPGDVPDPGPTWTPDRAAMAVAGLVDLVGLPICGSNPELYAKHWKASPAEVKGWDEAAARLFQRVAPWAAGGDGVLGAGADILVVSEGLSLMAYRRIGTLRALKAQNRAKKAADVETPAPAANGRSRAPDGPDDRGDGAYRLPRDLSAFVDQSTPNVGADSPPPPPA